MLGDLDHLRQSIRDILTTPKGTRIERRDYGSSLGDIIDAPINRETLVRHMADAADALDRWEPRFKLVRFILADIQPGLVKIAGVLGLYYPNWPRDTSRVVEVSL